MYASRATRPRTTTTRHIDTSSDVQAIGFGLNAVILLLVGLGVGAAGSGLTIRRFLQV